MENVFSNNALIMVSILLLIALIALVSLVVYVMILAVAVIMQFVFCLDIIFAVLYYAKLKKQIRKMKKSCESSQLFRF